ncbi:MAG: hypothetical protein RLY35_241 [Bacteroidota bacterium]|jgi:predicted DCC family thiol-disulfide oxidoreductase YuxK
MIRWVKKSFNKKVAATGLAWFRVFYLFFLLQDILLLLNNSHLVFDPIPYVWQSDINFKIILAIWSGAVISMMIGFKTRFNSVLNYILTIFIFSTLLQFEYHIYYVYSGVNFLLMFIPIERVFSIDNLILKFKNARLNQEYKPSNTTSVLSYWLILFSGIGLVYLGSVFYKLNDEVWLKGLGLWWPASFPVACNIPMQWILDQEYLIKFLGYFALLFELFFIFLFWFKPIRFWVAIIGIVFHIGIYLFFPIPFFAMSVCSLYLLCIPNKYWRFFSRFKFKKVQITVYYDAECPLCLRTKIFVEHFDFFQAISFKKVQVYYQSDLASRKIEYNQALEDLHGISKQGKVYIGFSLYRQILIRSIVFFPIGLVMYFPGISHLGKWTYKTIAKNRETQRCSEDSCVLNINSGESDFNPNDVTLLKNFSVGDFKVYLIVVFLSIAIFLQSIVIYFSPACHFLHGYVSRIPKAHEILVFCQQKMVKPTVFLTGITGHNVFLKSHFKEYTDVVRITYCDDSGNEIEVPIIDVQGKPSGFLSGCLWTNWTFKAMGPEVKEEIFLFGLKRYTANWLEERNDGGHYKFKVYTKKITVPQVWEEGILKRELSKQSWTVLGEVTWSNKEFNYFGQLIQ